MTIQAERLALLTNKENLPMVMEILKEGDEIRSNRLDEFVTGLKDYLQENATTPEHEYELSVIEETEDDYAGVYLWNTKVPREQQYLVYSVQNSAEEGEGECELTLCLQWTVDEDIWKKSGVKSLKSVARLHEHFRAGGFRKGGDWLRYKFIRQDDSTDEFLATMIDEEKRNSLFRQVNDCFWPLVQSTFKMVAAANKEIGNYLAK